MKYDIDWLTKKFDEVQVRPKYIFFWGHQPAKNGELSQSCFSQWWIQEFKVGEQTYRTAEHWMMAGKAALFGDTEVLDKILKAASPAEAKKLGREIKNFDQNIWEKERFDLVVKGNYHKFGQNEDLKEFLLNTGDRVLVEASPVDPVWGIGLAKDSREIEDPAQWKGLNLLGFALMEVRDMLRAE